MGSKKAPKAKAQKASNAFKYNNTAFNSDFGGATSNMANGTQTTESHLSPALKAVADTATTGLGGNLSFLSQDPSRQFSELQAGNNPYFNGLDLASMRAQQQQEARAQTNAQGTGNLNSTTLGGQLGAIGNDALMRRNANIINALQMNNSIAQTNAGVNQNALTGLANLSYPLASGANTNLMTGLSAANQTNQFNAQQAAAAQQLNIQSTLQQQQQQQAMIGNMIKAGVSLAAIPLTGGLSAAGGLGAGSSIGGLLGGFGSAGGLGSLGANALMVA